MEMKDVATARRKLEMVRETLQQFVEEKKLNEVNGNEVPQMEEDLLLSRLLSKLDSINSASESNNLTPTVPVSKHELCSDPTSTSSENKKEEAKDLKDLAKDIKIIKRQNYITHNLLSALIVITMIWQFGEVSVILAVKEKLAHPVRSIGDMIMGAFTRKGKKPLLEGSTLPPPIGGPELSNEIFPLLAPK